MPYEKKSESLVWLVVVLCICASPSADNYAIPIGLTIFGAGALLMDIRNRAKIQEAQERRYPEFSACIRRGWLVAVAMAISVSGATLFSPHGLCFAIACFLGIVEITYRSPPRPWNVRIRFLKRSWPRKDE